MYPGFDIRSLNKLLKNKMNNPYNRSRNPSKGKDLVEKRLQELKNLSQFYLKIFLIQSKNIKIMYLKFFRKLIL